MNCRQSHIRQAILTVFIVSYAISAQSVDAQEMIFPDRWKNAWTNTLPLYKKDTLSIRIFGDIMMHTKQIETAEINDSTYDFSSYFSLISDEIADADLAVANMEFTLAGKPYTGYPCFSAPDSFGKYLADCGFDIFLAANNHILDKGSAGASRTISRYELLEESHGIRYTGIAKDLDGLHKNTPLIILAKGIKVAIINFTYGTNLGNQAQWPKVNYMRERSLISKAIIRAKEENADLILVMPHWGTEYQLRHSKEQEDMAGWLIEQGADMIIGTHPHVVQDMVKKDNATVAYSLGNAISNMSAPNTQIGLILTVNIIREHDGDIVIPDPEIAFTWCSRPGGYNDSYTIIPIRKYIGRKDLWKGEWDYDKMITSYKRVMESTGTVENNF